MIELPHLKVRHFVIEWSGRNNILHKYDWICFGIIIYYYYLLKPPLPKNKIQYNVHT